MAARIKIIGPQCFHHREQNGTLRSDCIHCAQPVACTSPAQHTAGPRGLGPDIDPFFGFEAEVERNLGPDIDPFFGFEAAVERNLGPDIDPFFGFEAAVERNLGPDIDSFFGFEAAVERNLGPDIDPFFGFEAAVERNLDLQRRISYSETQRRNTMSTGLNRTEPILKIKEWQQTVNRMNDAYMYVGETERWVNTVRSEIDQDGGIQNQHLNSPFNMIDESGVRVRAQSDDSDCSLLEAIQEDLHRDAVRANLAAQSERHSQASWSGCRFVGKSDVDPALTLPQTLYSPMKPEHVMPSIEESKIPYPYVPLTSVKNRWK